MTGSTARTHRNYHVGNLDSLILNAAREMLEEVGPAKLSLRAVSQKVGVSATAVYHHFANRAELIGCLAVQGFRELGDGIRARNEGAAPEEKLREANLGYFGFARNNPALYQLMFGPEFSPETMPPELTIASEAAFGELKQVIAEVLDRDVAGSEVHKAALAGWSHTHGLASLVIHGVLTFPPGTSNERLVDSALQGLGLLRNDLPA